MSKSYLLDTNAIIRHFCSIPSLGREASTIIKQAEIGNGDILIISIISLMEIMYLAEKNRISVSLNETLIKILRTAEKINFHELHDRLILATARYYNSFVLSSDKLFLKVKGIKVIW